MRSAVRAHMVGGKARVGFTQCLASHPAILMEGALGERLKREFRLTPDPHVALAGLLDRPEGAVALESLWTGYMETARSCGLPFLATTPTRRANRERVLAANRKDTLIRAHVDFLRGVQNRCAGDLEMYVGGLLGCRGDAYTGAGALSEDEARMFHAWQVDLFRQAGVDFLYAGIMPTLPEAAGMARAMSESGLPYIISFTIERNGRLIDGTSIADAIRLIDSGTGYNPACYMANCVHPSIVREALLQPWNDTDQVRARFLGVQANTSPLPYASLDGAADLQCSDPADFAQEMVRLREICGIRIFGGCCGTDNRHMEHLARLISSTLGEGNAPISRHFEEKSHAPSAG